ncbi:MAG: ribosome biogenesis GTPase Der, partial [Gemmatimonadota bacterium]|nr:ribosome biogenesis GTPase Der [Gemmatimonadota bacterium]
NTIVISGWSGYKRPARKERVTGKVKSLPRVAVIGRPNVGKSTLFNRLIGRRVAIVDSVPGVTRDRLHGKIEWNGRAFELVDTAGILSEVLESFDTEIQLQIELAIRQAELLLFVVDAGEGPVAQEEDLVETLRRTGKPIVVAVNKTDLRRSVPLSEFHRWGFEKLIGISAIRGTGTGDLLDLVIQGLPAGAAAGSMWSEDTVQVAIIGKPNVGKSSLVNRIAGEERMVVSSVPGTTRDPVDTVIRYHGRNLVLIDTAGLRKKMKTAAGVDYYTLLRTVSCIERCDIAVLMLDSVEGMSRQDVRIASMAIDNGKGLILALNKWDLIPGKATNTAVGIEKDLKSNYPHLAHVPVIFISAETSQRLGRLLKLVVEVSEEHRKEVSQDALNELIRSAIEYYHPPAPGGRPIKIFGARQTGTRPPAFEIFLNAPEKLPEHYKRYLVRRLRGKFPFPGTPIRLNFSRYKGKRKSHRDLNLSAD